MNATEAGFVTYGPPVTLAGPPALVFIHGAGHAQDVWAPIARGLAQRGYPVVLADLPGHGRLSGPGLQSIEEMADWLLGRLRDSEARAPVLIGHSMGALVALEAASRADPPPRGLLLLGAALPMPVSETLLDTLAKDPERAYGLINQWSYSVPSLLGCGAQPGFDLANLNLRRMARCGSATLAQDLAACNAYVGGEHAVGRIACPTLLLSGNRDQMTPPRGLPALAAALCQVPRGARIISLPGPGHNLMAEAPGEVLAAICDFLSQQ